MAAPFASAPRRSTAKRSRGMLSARSCRAASLCALALTLTASGLLAQPLADRVPSLFGGAFRTSITPRAFNDVQQPRVADQFRTLSWDPLESTCRHASLSIL